MSNGKLVSLFLTGEKEILRPLSAPPPPSSLINGPFKSFKSIKKKSFVPQPTYPVSVQGPTYDNRTPSKSTSWSNFFVICYSNGPEGQNSSKISSAKKLFLEQLSQDKSSISLHSSTCSIQKAWKLFHHPVSNFPSKITDSTGLQQSEDSTDLNQNTNCLNKTDATKNSLLLKEDINKSNLFALNLFQKKYKPKFFIPSL